MFFKCTKRASLVDLASPKIGVEHQEMLACFSFLSVQMNGLTRLNTVHYWRKCSSKTREKAEDTILNESSHFVEKANDVKENLIFGWLTWQKQMSYIEKSLCLCHCWQLFATQILDHNYSTGMGLRKYEKQYENGQLK